jgi:NAD(P)-dependent dehydrogenase (short-subunit alcohol dehydrogenase family)
MSLLFSGRTAIITGGGGALGRAYALEFAKRGANVLVNDLPIQRNSGNGQSGKSAAQAVVDEIISGGGKAEANYDNVVHSPRNIVQHALKTFNSCDIVVNNAGILRDKSFAKSTDEEWRAVLDVHLNGTYGLCHEAWPFMIKQQFGRIVNIGSGAGLYGNFGQSSYSSAKMGIVGLTKTLAQEGQKHNIFANVVVPVAESPMTATVLPPQMLSLLAPEHIAPIVAYLSHESSSANGKIFECGGGWYSEVRWQRSAGSNLGRKGSPATAEAIATGMPNIVDFQSGTLSYPNSPGDALRDMLQAASSQSSQPSTSSSAPSSAVAAQIEDIAISNIFDSDKIFASIASHLTKSPTDILATVGTRAVQFVITQKNVGQKVWVLDCLSNQPNLKLFASDKHAEKFRAGLSLPAVAVSITLSDSDFLKICSGDLSTEWAYAMGKMKLDGSMGVAMKLKGLLALAGKLN